VDDSTIQHLEMEITYDDGTGRMISIPGLWEETGAATGVYQNAQQVTVVENWVRAVAHLAELHGCAVADTFPHIPKRSPLS
jgi:hypothetical protein